VRDHLAPGGVVLINVGHPSSSDRLEKVLSATMGRVFRTVLRDSVKDTNTVLVGTDAPASARTLDAAKRSMPPDLAAALPGGDVYTDDRAPVEWLIDASIVHVAAEGDR
jgi:hypothetical protein